jgi:hypothetical protein
MGKAVVIETHEYKGDFKAAKCLDIFDVLAVKDFQSPVPDR